MPGLLPLLLGLHRIRLVNLDRGRRRELLFEFGKALLQSDDQIDQPRPHIVLELLLGIHRQCLPDAENREHSIFTVITATHMGGRVSAGAFNPRRLRQTKKLGLCNACRRQ
jgi:hypothetical protein